jgi:hypothetical protein
MEVGEEAKGRLQTNDRLQEGESIYATYAVPREVSRDTEPVGRNLDLFTQINER